MDFIETKITGIGTDEVFGTSRGLYPFNSLLAETALRYISLKKNGGEIEGISHLRVCQEIYGVDNWTEYVEDTIAKNNNCTFFVVTPSSSYEGNIPVITNDGFGTTSGWRIPVASILTAKTKIETSIYVNKERKKVFVFVKRTTPAWVRLFSSLLFMLVPWLYGDNYDGYDSEENEFFKAINKGDGETIARIVNNLCENIDFEAIKTRAALQDWGSVQKKSQIEKVKKTINSINSTIENYTQVLAQQYAELAISNENLKALMAYNSNSKDDFYNFFKSRNLHYMLKGVDGYGNDYIDYSIVETIENYDQDEFFRIYNTPNSYMWYGERRKAAKVLHAIFGEERAVLRTECSFRLTNLSAITPNRYTLSGNFSSTVLPHPHIYYYNCLGSNKSYIDKYLAQGDWDMAIDQTIQAAKNLNFGDSTVVGTLMDHLFGTLKNVKFIILKDGTEMSPLEFIAHLEAEENKNEVKEQ